MKLNSVNKSFLVSTFTLALTACGGGSNSTPEATPTPTPTPAPTASQNISFGGIAASAQGQTPNVSGQQMTITGQLQNPDAVSGVQVQVASPSVTSGATQAAILPKTYKAEIDSAGNFSAVIGLNGGKNTLTLVISGTDGSESRQQQSVYFGKAISGGNSHSAALVNGKLYTWGRNNYGQLGLGKTSKLSDNADNPGTHPTTPQLVSSDTSFVSLALNQNTSLALDSDGQVWSWGYGRYGQLGHGDADSAEQNTENLLVPTKITSLSGVVSIVRGYSHSMVLKDNGTVCAFGRNNDGQLGDGTTNDSDYPKCNNGLTNIVQIAANSSASFALDKDGVVWGWGDNGDGNLGQGVADSATYSSPLKINVPKPVAEIAAGRDHILALTKEGEVYGWGLNFSSQLNGNGAKDESDRLLDIVQPTLLPWFNSNTGVANAIWANGNQSYARKADGKIYPWGQSMDGTLGVPAKAGLSTTNITEPNSAISGLEKVQDLGVGALHTIGLTTEGQLFTWGWSFEGSLGGGDTTIDKWSYIIPQAITVPTPAAD